MTTPTDDTPSTDITPSQAPPASSAWRWLGRFIRLMLMLAIVAGAGWICYNWVANPPKAQRRPPKPHATLVEVSEITPQTEQIVIHAMGTVIPARQIQLAARVSGQIVEVSPQFIPGGRFRKGQQLLQVEREDYELALRQSEGNLTQTESSLRIEMGQQSIAQREYELLVDELRSVAPEDEDLLLRQPQLDSQKAAIAIAQATLDKAQLDLTRTTVTAPFNAVVQARNVDLGAYVGPGAAVATLVGTDEYWVEVTVPVDELKWIQVPGVNGSEGSEVQVYHEPAWGPGAYRTGTVSRLLTELEPEGRMARLIVAVTDPLDLAKENGARHPLMLGAFVEPVEIQGAQIPNVVNVARTALHDGNRVWIMTPERKLNIREVEIVWSGDDFVFVSKGLSAGELLVTSDLGAPVQGMALRTSDDPPEEGDVPAKPAQGDRQKTEGQS